MKSVAAVCLCVSAVMLAAAIEGGAQQRPADPNDPRVGLKAGLKDAGEAARNMKRISSLPKPEGFFDPANPAGTPIPAERDPNLPPEPRPDPNSPAAVAQANMLGFANSDLAFSGKYATYLSAAWAPGYLQGAGVGKGSDAAVWATARTAPLRSLRTV